jgi:protein tyrosine/serine phosphatase
LDRFLETIANKDNQPVYIHCASASRVGAFWLVKRVLQDGWTVEKAIEEARLIGLSSPALEKFALDYIAAHRS